MATFALQVQALMASKTGSENPLLSPLPLSASKGDDPPLVDPPTAEPEPQEPKPQQGSDAASTGPDSKPTENISLPSTDLAVPRGQNGLMITFTGKPTPLKMSQGWDSKTLWYAMSPEQQKLHIQHFEKVSEINRLVQDWAKQNKIIEDTTRRIQKARGRRHNTIRICYSSCHRAAKT